MCKRKKSLRPNLKKLIELRALEKKKKKNYLTHEFPVSFNIFSHSSF